MKNKIEIITELSADEFGQAICEFKIKHGLSGAELGRIFLGKKHCSTSMIYRLEKKRVNDIQFNAMLPGLESGLFEWMEDQGFSTDEINEDLVGLLKFQEKIMLVNRCELVSTAVKFFGLKADPFDVDRVPSEEEIFTNTTLDDIANRVCDAVLYKRFICISGAVGTGKTSMKIRIARELEKAPQRIHLIYPEFFDMNAVNVGAIASYILEEFDIKPPRTSTSRVRKIREILTSLEQEDARIALVFDECHRLNDKVLSSLKNFWEMTNGGYNRLLGIVLFGQPKFVESTLRDVKFREIAERVQILEMPSLEKTAEQYLAHKIAAAGGDINQLFEPAAIKRICKVAKTPLSLGNLANTALMEAFTHYEEKQVTSEMLNLPDQPRLRGIRRAA